MIVSMFLYDLVNVTLQSVLCTIQTIVHNINCIVAFTNKVGNWLRSQIRWEPIQFVL